MPEIISKHPEIVISVLKSANMKCAAGVKPKILTSCPDARFCALDKGTGELCIYSPDEVNSSTQMTSLDFIHYSDFIVPAGSLAFMIFLAGVVAGLKIKS